MKRAAIVIGHGPRIDKGAVSQDGRVNELQWNRELAIHMHAALGKLGIQSYHVNRVTERLQPVKETNVTGADCAIELHLNSADGKASGTEMIAISPNGIKFGQLLLTAAIRALGLPNRGVKKPWRGRGERWLKGTRMPAVIVESFFIDNENDLEIGTSRIHRLGSAYAQAISEFLNT